MTAPALARAAVSRWLGQAPNDGLSIDTVAVLLLVTELVTNSVRHAHIGAGQPLRLRVRVGAATVHLSVWDAGTQGAVSRRSPRRDEDIGGFGLNLIAQLSRSWGVDRDADGTTVWVELATTLNAGD